jgi:hypothetical protein
MSYKVDGSMKIFSDLMRIKFHRKSEVVSIDGHKCVHFGKVVKHVKLHLHKKPKDAIDYLALMHRVGHIRLLPSTDNPQFVALDSSISE